jgi:hypothetical protein
MKLRDNAGLPEPNIAPPVVAESGDPFAGLRVAHLVARLPRGESVRLADVVDHLNAEYLDWSFSRNVVAAVAVQLAANWQADFRTTVGFELIDGARGDELLIEDTPRAQTWLVGQVERFAAQSRLRLQAFARHEGDPS